jgi:hypothetical protein
MHLRKVIMEGFQESWDNVENGMSHPGKFNEQQQQLIP